MERMFAETHSAFDRQKGESGITELNRPGWKAPLKVHLIEACMKSKPRCGYLALCPITS